MIKWVRISVLVENNAKNEKLKKGKGLSMLVETENINGEKTKILFDTGDSGEILSHNVATMNIKLNDVDAIVISHGHWDHTGGLLAALDLIGKRTPIILHPDALLPRVANKPKIRLVGIQFRKEDIEKKGGVLIFNKYAFELSPGIFVTGEIARVTDYEEPPKIYFICRDGDLVPDKIFDDQALAIKLADGRGIIVTGCSHSGIINITKQVKTMLGVKKFALIIGGFHLIGAKSERIKRTVEDLIKLGAEKIAPNHCSGEEILNIVPQDKLIIANAGEIIEIKSKIS